MTNATASKTKAKKPTKAQIEALRQKTEETLKAWGYGTGTEEQRQAHLAACRELEAAQVARRPSLASRNELVARRLSADGETF